MQEIAELMASEGYMATYSHLEPLPISYGHLWPLHSTYGNSWQLKAIKGNSSPLNIKVHSQYRTKLKKDNYTLATLLLFFGH